MLATIVIIVIITSDTTTILRVMTVGVTNHLVHLDQTACVLCDSCLSNI